MAASAVPINLGLGTIQQIKTPSKTSNSAQMINILGKEIEEYRLKTFSEYEFFFDYGKKEIKDKRKMGHLTILKN